jgi:hypothetical protein
MLLALSALALESLVIAPFTITGLKEFYDQEGHKRYSTLKSLTLAPFADIVNESLRLASECFPGVVDVTLIGRESDFLIEGLANTDGAVISPNMRSLALRNLYAPLRNSNAPEDALCSLVAFRNLRDLPLRTLYLDKASMRQMSSLHQLRDKVEVVELDK